MGERKGYEPKPRRLGVFEKISLQWKIMWGGPEAVTKEELALLHEAMGISGSESSDSSQGSATTTAREPRIREKNRTPVDSTDTIWGTGPQEARINHKLDVEEAASEAKNMARDLSEQSKD